MATDKGKRELARLLDEAEAAALAGDWEAVAEKSRAALSIDPDSRLAQAFKDRARVRLSAHRFDDVIKRVLLRFMVLIAVLVSVGTALGVAMGTVDGGEALGTGITVVIVIVGTLYVLKD